MQEVPMPAVQRLAILPVVVRVLAIVLAAVRPAPVRERGVVAGPRASAGELAAQAV
ncbi:hypothetical protein D9M71_304850 [compost metagenome]